MTVLLEGNGIRSEAFKAYPHQTDNVYPKCKVTEEPKEIRTVSFHGLSSSFNCRMRFDHMLLDKNIKLHDMDSCTRPSHGAFVEIRTINQAINLFERTWASQYGYIRSLIADHAFITDNFQRHADSVGMKLFPLLSQRHNKNVLESKRTVLGYIFCIPRVATR